MKKIVLITLLFFAVFFPFVNGASTGYDAEYYAAEAVCSRHSAEVCESDLTKNLSVGELTFNCVYSEEKARCVSDVDPPSITPNYDQYFLPVFFLVLIIFLILFEIFKVKEKNAKRFFIAKFLMYSFVIFITLTPKNLFTELKIIESLLTLIALIVFLSQPIISKIGLPLMEKEGNYQKLVVKIILVLEILMVISLLLSAMLIPLY